ncbi:YcxB family protein [Arenicella xantha]|uniref:YcxB-like protein n=1 Tax=Arenicella xantha TaxID=644221 RepID=A0A395JG76_9GAMM|nr:YcxB family protein [Arenicella xantha]RBP48813.1 YcxB-like protein [Arenicella xantha]
MEKTFKYEKEDWQKFQSYLETDLCRSKKMWHESVWFNLISWFVIAIVFFTFFQSKSEFSWATAGIVSFFFVSIYAQLVLTGIKFKKLCAPSEKGSFIGEHRFRFNESSIQSEGLGYTATHDWSVVKRVAKTNDAIYLFLDNAVAYIFPLSQIEDSGQFYEYINTKINVAASSN